MGEEKLLHYLDEYDQLRPKLFRFKDAINEQFKEIVLNEKLELGFPVQIRIKEWGSIKSKIETKRFNVKKTLIELQDLIGVRCILLSIKDIQKVENVIKSDFEVVKKYNPSEKLNHDQFGYNSVHYILKVPDYWKKVPSFKNLDDFSFELQIRTLSQHIWAETSTAFNYKQIENVPRELLRGMGRISALLETVDFEIDRLITERQNYRDNLDHAENSKNETLNIDLTESILKNAFGERITNGESLEILFAELLDNGFHESQKFKAILSKYSTDLFNEEKNYINSIESNNQTDLDLDIKERQYVLDYLGIVRYILRKEVKNYKPSKRRN